MDQYYQGKVAVVTGAAGVICSEVARDLASLGCTVALVDLSFENAEKVAEDIRANGGKCGARVYYTQSLSKCQYSIFEYATLFKKGREVNYELQRENARSARGQRSDSARGRCHYQQITAGVQPH